MDSKVMSSPALLLALAAGLTGCASSGSGSGAVGPAIAAAPPPQPAPQPAPPPTPPPPGPNGLVSAEPFAVQGIGYAQPAAQAAGAAAQEAPAPVAFRYLPAADTYEILVPDYQEGRLQLKGYNGSFDASGWQSVSGSHHEVSRGASTDVQKLGVTLRRPAGPLNPDEKLRYTSWGHWTGWENDGEGRELSPSGLFAYGIPTSANDMPLAGTATYRADVLGEIGQPNGPFGFYGEPVRGSAELRFDFAAGTLAGHMDASVCPWDCLAAGRYAFRDTVYAQGATGFSGRFDMPNGTGADGFFQGNFTGPKAAELLARFQAPVFHPESRTWNSMYGIWVGQKQD